MNRQLFRRTESYRHSPFQPIANRFRLHLETYYNEIHQQEATKIYTALLVKVSFPSIRIMLCLSIYRSATYLLFRFANSRALYTTMCQLFQIGPSIPAMEILHCGNRRNIRSKVPMEEDRLVVRILGSCSIQLSNKCSSNRKQNSIYN